MDKAFMYEYQFRGVRWAFFIEAQSKPEAEARIQQMAEANYVGEVAARMPVRVPCLRDFAVGCAVGVLLTIAIRMMWG